MAVSASQTGLGSPTDAGLQAREYVHRAFLALWIIFTAAPIIAGADKFLHLLTNWDKYLAPIVSNTLHVPAHQFMMGVGVVEIVAGIIVAIKPRIGAWIVAAWLLGIIVNLALNPHHFWDVALRDLGLMVGASALGFLATAEEKSRLAA